MNARTNKCPLCGANQQPGTTMFAVDLKFGVVVVREVPALVCSQCGEAEVDDAAAAQLEAIVEDARRKQAVVEVTHWQEAVA